MTFDVILKGYNSETSDTDHLIKWINANSIEEVAEFCKEKGWDFDYIDELMCDYDHSDGVDFDLIKGTEMFESTGEIRSPRRGELYKSTDGQIELAVFDFEKVIAPIYRYVDNDNARRSQRQKKQVYT